MSGAGPRHDVDRALTELPVPGAAAPVVLSTSALVAITWLALTIVLGVRTEHRRDDGQLDAPPLTVAGPADR